MKNLSSFDMASQKIVNVADPTAAQDAATKAYVDRIGGKVSVTATTDQTATAATAHITCTVLANSVQVGTVFKIQAAGNADNGTTSLLFAVTIAWGGVGGVVLLTPGFNNSTTANTNRNWRFEGTLTFRTIGATGSVMVEGCLIEKTSDAGGLERTRLQSVGPTTVNTTIDKDLVFGWTLGATTGAPHIRTQAGFIEVVKL